MLSDEESMNQIKQLAEMIGAGNQGEAPDLSALFGAGSDTAAEKKDDAFPFDMGMIMQLAGLASKASVNDKNTELLLALKPHLSEEKQPKVDKAVKLLKLMAIWGVVKESGLLNNLDIL